MELPLCCAQFQPIAGLKNVQFQCVLPSGECKMVNIYICSVILLQKMSNRGKSLDLPRQEIGPALSTQHYCSSFKSFFISKNHHTWGIHILIPHKQNPHTEINKLAVTAKRISQPGIQFCVESVAVQSWQTDLLSWAAWETSLPCPTFMSHLNTEHTVICQRWENIFQLQYGAVNRSPSQQMCV